jgi:hypothetical protein
MDREEPTAFQPLESQSTTLAGQLLLTGYTNKSLPKENAMKRMQELILHVLPAAALIVGLCLMSQPSMAQNAASPNPDPNAQQQSMPQPGDQAQATQNATFTGKIVKSGSKLVLTDADGKTSYQLDDQKKAKQFMNQNVKVTGVLDASTGTIRVSAIDPA